MIIETVVFMLAPMYLLVKMSRLYLPKDISNQLQVRIQLGFMLTANLFSKTSKLLHVDDEIIAFKKFLKKALKYLPKFQPKDKKVQITDSLVGNVPIRIYKPVTSINEISNPAVIFYHGGAFIFDKIDQYNQYLYSLAKMTNFTVISVMYRKAPEHPFPIPIDDCIETTRYIFENAHQFNIDAARIALAGDSAGGCAVAVCAQELAREKKHSPKLQALIYPWVQMYDHKLPSMIEYRKKHSITTLTPLNLTLCYLGRLNPKKAMIECLKNNEHMLLLDEQTRLKYESFINPQLIPDEYKKDRAYYETYRNSHANRVAKTLKPNSVLNTDLEFRKEILNLFNKKVSPLLADDEDLKDLPPAYFQLLEWDMLKDEGLIYSERLRLNGCKVHVELFEKAFHGIAPSLDYTMGFEAARHMFNNMVDKLKEMV